MKILAIIHPSNSHLNAVRRVLRILTEEGGHEVSLVSSFPGEKLLKRLGFPFYLLNSMPFGSGFEYFVSRSKDGQGILGDYTMRFEDFYYKQRRSGIKLIFEEARPEIVLLDILYATDTVLLYPLLKEYGGRLIYLSTKPSLRRTSSTPPVNCYEIPLNDDDVDRAWKRYNRKHKFKEKLESIRYLLHDDLSIIKEKLDVHPGINEEFPLVNEDFVGRKFDRIPELTLVPEEFEFQPFIPGKGQYHVGFQYEHRKEDLTEFIEIENFISKARSTGSRIVYCSFGSVYQFYSRKVARFLRKLLQAVATMPEIHLILSLKREFVPVTEIGAIPSNVEIYDFVPQLYVLKHSDLFITHGGINSIKEAIHQEVPLLVYPVNPNWDQNGNSARIEYHRLGMRGEMKIDSIRNIANKMQTMLRDESYRQRIKAFKSADLKYTPEIFLNLFEQLLQESPVMVDT